MVSFASASSLRDSEFLDPFPWQIPFLILHNILDQDLSKILAKMHQLPIISILVKIQELCLFLLHSLVLQLQHLEQGDEARFAVEEQVTVH